MKKSTLAVLFGGCSSEYAISLQSAYAVITNLDRAKYDLVLLGITRDGRWYRYTGDLEHIHKDTWHTDQTHCIPAVISPDRDTHGLLFLSQAGPSSLRLDAAFPVLHGKNGEDGTVQGLLELAGIPIVGCGTLSSALCMDKEIAHRLAAAEGVAVPRGVVFRAGANLDLLPALTQPLTYPLFVKPARAGSSFGVGRVESPGVLAQAVEEALQHDSKVLIEEAVPGFEVGCAVLDGPDLTVGRVDEIALEHGFFDFVEKYNLVTSRIYMPARITLEQEQTVQAVAVRLYRAMECSGFARVDLFLTPEGKVVFNEINTIPGFTGHSRYPSMMQGAGLDFPCLLDRMTAWALQR
ncbi:MAG: D-alanine--D-serine ligase VanG [Oscillospiraceae bacterium]|nr:D-alanine--D-serine ligase VanG [Oscillospiraceae bacterium]